MTNIIAESPRSREIPSKTLHLIQMDVESSQNTMEFYESQSSTERIRWGYVDGGSLLTVHPANYRLANDSIRLSKMRLDANDDMMIWVQPFPINGAPEYFAISYFCWQGECDRKILVNNGEFFVKPNLRDALREIKGHGTARPLGTGSTTHPS